MNVLFVSGGIEDPATRFRVSQFFTHFSAAGVQCTHRFAYGHAYNRLFNTRWAAPYKLACRVRRAAHTVVSAGYDLVVMQRTAFNTTAWPEQVAALRGGRLIFDFDDAIFLDSRGAASRRHRSAFDRMVALSSHVIAGNSYLAAVAGATDRTTIIPTVIDTDRYTPAAPRPPSRPLTIGWMGTAGNFAYFSEMLPSVLQILDEFSSVRFKIVSNSTFRPLQGHPQVDQKRWTEAEELEDLRSFDIGIMPLTDSDWTRGKCAFKLIQYMAVGRPVVASSVGANVDLLRGTDAGFLAADTREWAESLRSLLLNPELRAAMGQAARRRVESSYSIRSVLPTYLSLFASVAGSGARRPAGTPAVAGSRLSKQGDVRE